MKTCTLTALRAIYENDPARTKADREALLVTLGLAGAGSAAPAPSDRVISFEETAKRLNRSKRSVHMLCSRGVLRKATIPGCGRATGFLSSDIDALLGKLVTEGAVA